MLPSLAPNPVTLTTSPGLAASGLQPWLNSRGLSHTEQLRMTERYRRPNFGRIEIEVTYEDPGAFESPLQATVGAGAAFKVRLLAQGLSSRATTSNPGNSS